MNTLVRSNQNFTRFTENILCCFLMAILDLMCFSLIFVLFRVRLLSVGICLFLLCFIIGLLYLCLVLCQIVPICVRNYDIGDKFYLGEIERKR